MEISRLEANLSLADYQKAISAAEHLETAPAPRAVCVPCGGIGFRTISELPLETQEWVRLVLLERPEAGDWDQSPNTPEHVVLDVLYLIHQLGHEKVFLFLGDDDFHSIVLAKLAPHLRIEVLEIDPRVVKRINDLASEHSLCVTARIHDVRRRLPDQLVGAADGFYADPPYSAVGLQLFASRGINSLTKTRGSWGVMALPFTRMPLDVRSSVRSLQARLIEWGCVVAEFRPAFRWSSNHLRILSGLIKFERIEALPSEPSDPCDLASLYAHWY